MKKKEEAHHKFESLSEAHRAFGLPGPLHPLVSLIDNMDGQIAINRLPNNHVLNFYKISYRLNLAGKLKYGRGYYDFDEGGLLFAAPGQVIGSTDDYGDHTGYSLLIHPDFLLTYSLAKKIRQYGFFSYDVSEALHLSGQEKETIISVFKTIDLELKSRLDDCSQDVIISHIEVLLNYANRFYKRQFITRKVVNNDLLQKLEDLLENYFNDEELPGKGIPTVQYLSENLNISPSYLSDMLRSLTGRNARQHIQDKLIEKAKEKLTTTSLSVSEVAYALGFEYPQSFSHLFKAKTNISPSDFRSSFN